MTIPDGGVNYEKLRRRKAEMEQLTAQMADAKKHEPTEASKKVKELGFISGMLKGALAEDRKKK